MRARLINRFEKYGNDIDDVDNISAELLRHYCKEVEKYRNPRGGIFTPARIPSPPMCRLARSWGLRPMMPRRANSWRMEGSDARRDMQGPTAVLKSVSKLDNYLLSNGTLLNVNSPRHAGRRCRVAEAGGLPPCVYAA